jgi:hypothetical protein
MGRLEATDSSSRRRARARFATTHLGASDHAVGSLRRAGAAHLVRFRGETTGDIPLPRPMRSREWMKFALLECGDVTK